MYQLHESVNGEICKAGYGDRNEKNARVWQGVPYIFISGRIVFLSFMSLIVAVILVQIVVNLSSFNELIGRNLGADFIHNPGLLFGSIAIALGIGLLSGLYPAFLLPSIPTIMALKGSFKSRQSGHTLRKILITLQFAISIFVVVCTLFMQDQIDYVRNQDLGFNKDNVLVLPIQDTLVQNQIGSIKNELLQNPNITAATTSYNVLGMGVGGPVMYAEGENGMQQQAFSMIAVGEDYFKAMDITDFKGP